MPKILLLEDDEAIAFGVQTGLERAGYQVLCCASLEQAADQLSAAVDLALLT